MNKSKIKESINTLKCPITQYFYFLHQAIAVTTTTTTTTAAATATKTMYLIYSKEEY